MADPRTLLIVNPKSQGGTLGKRWPSLSRIARRHLPGFEVVHTSARGDASIIARRALAEGFSKIVAIGGDGTINEVVNGFFSDGASVAGEACLGILPFGTGGDLRRTLGLPTDFEKACQIVSSGTPTPLDLGLVQYLSHEGEPMERYFINIASFGMSGEVNVEVNQGKKRLGGKLTFLLGSAKVGMRYKSKRVRMHFDGDIKSSVEMDINTVAVANAQYFGGGMKVAPNAQVDDGRFDLIAIGHMGKVESLLHGSKIYKGDHLQLENVSERRVTKMHAEPCYASDEVLLDIDGESPGRLPASFEIVPQSIRVICP